MKANERLVHNLADGALVIGARRQQIMDAAAELFSIRGYHGTSMQDIGQRVGLLKGSLYAHVATKEELLLEIVSAAARRFLEVLSPISYLDAPATAKLRLALHAHIKVIIEQRAASTVFLHEWRHLEGQPALWVQEERRRYEVLWEGIFSQGIAEGSFRSDLDVRFATVLALSASNWTYQWHDPQAGPVPETIAESFTDLLLGGCRA